MPFHVARAAEKLVSVVDISVTDLEELNNTFIESMVMPRDDIYFLSERYERPALCGIGSIFSYKSVSHSVKMHLLFYGHSPRIGR